MSHCRAFIQTDATQFSLGRCSPAPTASRPVCRGGDRVFYSCRSHRSSIHLSQLHLKAASPVKPRAGSFASPCFLSAPAGTHFALPQRAPDSFVFSSARPTLFTYDIYLQRRRVIKCAEAKIKPPQFFPPPAIMQYIRFR